MFKTMFAALFAALAFAGTASAGALLNASAPVIATVDEGSTEAVAIGLAVLGLIAVIGIIAKLRRPVS